MNLPTHTYKVITYPWKIYVFDKVGVMGQHCYYALLAHDDHNVEYVMIMRRFEFDCKSPFICTDANFFKAAHNSYADHTNVTRRMFNDINVYKNWINNFNAYNNSYDRQWPINSKISWLSATGKIQLTV